MGVGLPAAALLALARCGNEIVTGHCCHHHRLAARPSPSSPHAIGRSACAAIPAVAAMAHPTRPRLPANARPLNRARRKSLRGSVSGSWRARLNVVREALVLVPLAHVDGCPAEKADIDGHLLSLNLRQHTIGNTVRIVISIMTLNRRAEFLIFVQILTKHASLLRTSPYPSGMVTLI